MSPTRSPRGSARPRTLRLCDLPGYGWYERYGSPEGVLLPQEITEFVNAGIGKGARLGSGKLWANKATIETNLVAALVQAGRRGPVA